MDSAVRPTLACRTCGAAMWWAISPVGRAIPIDRDPVDGGDYYVRGTVDTARGPKPSLGNATGAAAEGLRYRSHFKSCADASFHSRKRRA